MTVSEAGGGEARVRWLVVGGFSLNPQGRRFAVSPDSFAQAMVDAKLAGKVKVADRLGGGDTREYDVAFTKPRSFQLAELVATVPELKALRALAEELGAADPAKRPTPDKLVERITALVGKGKLTDAVETALHGAEAPKPAPAPAPAASPEGAPATPADIDSILAQTETAKPASSVPASAISAFIRASRGDAPKATVTGSGSAKAARAAIEAAIYAAAGDILREASMARVESAWRGLKLIVDQMNSAVRMKVDVIDTTADKALEAVEASLPDDPIDYPDAVFYTDVFANGEGLAPIASLAERLTVPAVVGLGTAFFGASDGPSIAAKIDDEGGGLPASWGELRNDESSRWLCAVANRVVLATDGTGALRRAVFGSPVFAIGAMLANSFRHTGSFARIFGGQGALKAPGTYEISTGREGGTAVPTEAFLSVRAQTRMAALGVIGLGSARNTDNVVISVAPTVRGGEDLVPLPAQILTGRIVRFAEWVRNQIPDGATDTEISQLFQQAAGVFLFPGSTDAGLQARVISGEKSGRAVLVSATVRAEHAGTPFHFAFSLPLGR